MEEMGAGNTCPHCGYSEGAALESLLHLPPGTVLQNKYLLGRVLGQGGFGITYLAWDKTLNIKLAVKEYLPQQLVTRTAGQSTVTVYKSSLSAEFRYGLNKFLEEARTLARFNEHPNIVTVRDYFEANNTAYLVMNYLEGVTLQNYLAEKSGKITVEQALKIFMPVLDVLKEVHAAGILHRDISPDNLLINTEGRVILIDFGAARQAMGEKSKSLSVIMKAGYSPPEQYQSRGKQGPWTDIYAVAATVYRTLTGQAPLEATDRMAEDDLITPSELGVIIEPDLEKTLLNALAVKAKDRYQTVEEFQSDLIASSLKDKAFEGFAGVKPEKTDGFMVEDKKRVEEEHKQKLKADVAEEASVPEKKPLLSQQPVDRGAGQVTPYTISRKTIKTAALIAVCGLLILGAVSLFGVGDEGAVNLSVKDASLYEVASEDDAEESAETYASATIAALDADYYIDYENGTILIGDLPIGARVVDSSWEWEFRTDSYYLPKSGDETKPVTWIIVAKNHYDGLSPHVTILSEDLISRDVFDSSTNRGHKYAQWGYNHWGDSGTANATRGLRPWLNSTGIHPNESFYQAFSDSFKEAVLITTLSNKEWQSGSTYSTEDRVFIPSSTELGDTTVHSDTYQIGTVYPYFQGVGKVRRVALLDRDAYDYWTRSPDSRIGGWVRYVNDAGEFESGTADSARVGVRPALNLKSEILVSEIRN